MTIREKGILASVLEYKKKIRGNHAFSEIIKLQFRQNCLALLCISVKSFRIVVA